MGHRPRGHPGHRRPLLEEGKTVGAICGATLGLARTGLLDGRAHTSNRPELLQVEGYHGADHYVDDRVVVDGNLITAPATGYLEFTRELEKQVSDTP